MRIFLTIFLAFVSICASGAEIDMAYSVNNYWSDWERASGVGIYGQCSGFSLSYYGDQYWNWFFRFQIQNYTIPTKEAMKSYRKNDQWIVYYGTVEYYVTDKHPTIEACMKAAGITGFIPGEGYEYLGHRVKRTANATIKIKPYKKFPQVYNIYFDGVGLAIDLRSVSWHSNK
ncbi:MAG: hypothetical protein HDR79_06115 [Bacteroides sp.]|nr:hypothetical protein [Bacteroides sp.]MBD5364508.1 hypothetical protein [Bacteroides sp.]